MMNISHGQPGFLKPLGHGGGSLPFAARNLMKPQTAYSFPPPVGQELPDMTSSEQSQRLSILHNTCNELRIDVLELKLWKNAPSSSFGGAAKKVEEDIHILRQLTQEHFLQAFQRLDKLEKMAKESSTRSEETLAELKLFEKQVLERFDKSEKRKLRMEIEIVMLLLLLGLLGIGIWKARNKYNEIVNKVKMVKIVGEWVKKTFLLLKSAIIAEKK